MPNLGPAELILILLVALVVFGPRKLPELGKSLGHTLREFRRHTDGLTGEFRSSLNASAPGPAAPDVAPPAVAAVSPAAVSPAAPPVADHRP